MSEPKFQDDLEDLLNEALLQAGQKTRKRFSPTYTERDPGSRVAWTDPAMWLLQGQVQLVHRESNVETLVGLFDEFTHQARKDARKLIASQRLGEAVPKIEYVTGDAWVGIQLETKRKTPDTKLQIVEDLILDMGVSAPAVILEISLVGGGVSRAILTQTTRFEGFTPRTILTLPAGMDVLEGLTRGSKERIWQEVKKVLGMADDE